MIKKLAFATLLFAAALMTGCASVPMASPEADAKAKQFKTVPDKAGIYIYRNEFVGAAIKMPVTIDGTLVGSTIKNSYIFRQVAPGKHSIDSQGGKSKLDVDTKGGGNYFIWQEVKMGAFAAGSALQLVSEAQGKAGVNECKLAE